MISLCSLLIPVYSSLLYNEKHAEWQIISVIGQYKVINYLSWLS